MVEHMASIFETLGSIPSTIKKKINVSALQKSVSKLKINSKDTWVLIIIII